MGCRAYSWCHMKTLFTSEAISGGGRSGTLQSPDGLLDTDLGNPLEKDIATRGPNSELLFAGDYSACYHRAVISAARKLGTPVVDSTVRALVNLVGDDSQGYGLTVEVYGQNQGPSDTWRPGGEGDGQEACGP